MSSSPAHSEKRLLDRSNTHQPFISQLKQDTATPGLLSAIHAPSANARLDKDKENLSTHSSSEDSDRRLSLTPIHTTGIVLPAQHKGHLLQVKRTSLDSVSLSPLHKPEKVADVSILEPRKSPTAPSPLSPIREPLAATPSKQPTGSLSQHVREPLVATPSKQPTVSLSQHVREPLAATPSKQPTVSLSQHVLVPPLQTNVSSSSEFYEQFDDQLSLDASGNIAKKNVLDDSMVRELNELQDALKAAGLPQIEEESDSPPLTDEPYVAIMVEGKASPILSQDRAMSDLTTAVQKLTSDNASNDGIRREKDSQLQLDITDEFQSEQAPKSLEFQVQESGLQSTITISQQRPLHKQPTEPHPLATKQPTEPRPLATKQPTEPRPLATKQPTEPRPLTTKQPTEPRPLATKSKTSALRETLRVIASEELTSLSKGILYEEGRGKTSTHRGQFDVAEHNERLSVKSYDTPIPLEVVPTTVDHKENQRNRLSKTSSILTVHIPTGSHEDSSKLEEELADILSPSHDFLPPQVDYTCELSPKIPQKQLSQRKPPARDRQSNIGSVKRPFQVSSRLYPGPKPTPKAPTAKQTHKTKKSSLDISRKKIKRAARQKSPPIDIDTLQIPPVEMVARQIPPVEMVTRQIPPVEMVTRQSPPVEMVARQIPPVEMVTRQISPVDMVARRGGGECAGERAWQEEEKVHLHTYVRTYIYVSY